MSVVNKWYRAAFAGQYSATAARRVDWVTDAIKVSLHTNTYSFAQDSDDFFNDATNELSTAGGYTAGGVTLGTKSIDVGNDVADAVDRRERAVDVVDVHGTAGGRLQRHGRRGFNGPADDEHQLRRRPVGVVGHVHDRVGVRRRRESDGGVMRRDDEDEQKDVTIGAPAADAGDEPAPDPEPEDEDGE